jgi:cellulose biosynthesis protein BcsQ
MSKPSGKIITFYSYKGGTGRTMALSNVAWILASAGKRVLLIDWDLEAPGLHRYLRPFLLDRELSTTPGLIDYAWDAVRACTTPRDKGPDFPSLTNYVVGLDWSFHGDGIIDFIPAGLQDANYAQRVNTFNWDNFYERLGGGKLLEAERDALREEYDYILIDSRTGVSDTSSICTVHMPDSVVILFTLNRQSIKGAAAIAASIQAQRPEEDFRIFPVPTRVEQQEDLKVNAARTYGRRTFAPCLRYIDAGQQAAYWDDVETPYRTFYAFEEVPAAFKDEPQNRQTVLYPNERIAYWITDQAVKELTPETPDLCQQVVKAYALNEDEDAAIKWPPPPRVGILTRIDRRIARTFGKFVWRYAIILLLCGIVGCGALYSQLYNEEVETKASLTSATNENNNLTRKNDDLTRKNDDLTRENGNLSKKNDDQAARITLLTSANRSLSGTISGLCARLRNAGIFAAGCRGGR